MPLTITPERYSAIRTKVKQRRAETLVAEIAATDWDAGPYFRAVDDLLKFADTFTERSQTDPSRLKKHR